MIPWWDVALRWKHRTDAYLAIWQDTKRVQAPTAEGAAAEAITAGHTCGMVPEVLWVAEAPSRILP